MGCSCKEAENVLDYCWSVRVVLALKSLRGQTSRTCWCSVTSAYWRSCCSCCFCCYPVTTLPRARPTAVCCCSPSCLALSPRLKRGRTATGQSAMASGEPSQTPLSRCVEVSTELGGGGGGSELGPALHNYLLPARGQDPTRLVFSRFSTLTVANGARGSF